LNEQQVNYLIVGGYALNLYIAKPRNTGDLDIWIEVSESNSLKMKNIVEEFCNVSNVDKNVFMNRKLRVPIGNPPVCLDILMNIDGLNFEECFNRKNIISWEAVEIPFLSKEDLITTKKVVNRPQDKADVAALLNS
jgi:predicted nucleotidyltransferase